MEENPPQNKAEVAGPKDKSANQKEETTPVLLAALSKLIHANRAKERAEKKRTECRENWHFWLVFVEIALVAIYAIVTILEWNTFDNERKIMEREFKSSETNSQAQLIALQGQWNEMRYTRESDERAWVFIDLPDNSISPESTNFVLTIFIKNSGKTPALITGNMWAVVNDIKVIPESEAEVRGGEESVLLPNQTETLKIPMNPSWIDATQTIPIYAYGTIFYMDIFSKKHWTQFCFQILDQGRQYKSFGTHRSCDDLKNAKSQ